MDTATLYGMAAALIGFIVVAGLGFAMAGDRPSSAGAAKRIKALTSDTRSESGRARTAAETQSQRRKQILQSLKAQEKQDRKAKLTLESRLIQAGLNTTVRNFWIASGVLAIIGFVLPLLFHTNILIAFGISAGAGLGLPRWLIGMMAASRAKKFTAEFPNAIDVIVRGIKSGLPVHDCLRLIAAESPEPLATEFKRMIENVAMGLGMDQSLEKMYARMPTSEVRFFAIVLAIQQRTGGNLAEALNNLSIVLRSRKLLREKIKALSGEAVASAFIIGSLPPGIMTMVTVTTPAYMLPLFSDPRGHVILGIGAIMEGVGIFVMRRMINFKF